MIARRTIFFYILNPLAGIEKIKNKILLLLYFVQLYLTDILQSCEVFKIFKTSQVGGEVTI